MKKVLVTGASGFIGRHCIPFLLKRGYQVCGVSSKKQPDKKGVQWIECDLLRDNLFSLVESIKPTHLLHFAWNVSHGKYWTALDNLDWLKSSLSLLQAFATQGGKRVVMAGTCAEYDWKAAEFSESTSLCKPQSLYGTCKLALHMLLQAMAEKTGLSQAWGRIFFLYGPHEYQQRFLPTVIKGLLKKEIVPCSHCGQIRDFMYVEDVADAFVALLDSELQGCINIASGHGLSLKEVVQKVTQKLGGAELIQFGALTAPKDDPAKIIAETDRLNRELQWTPRFSLEEGLERMIAWLS